MGPTGIARHGRVTVMLGAAVALATASAAFAAGHVSAGSYSGTTSEHGPVTLKVASGGHAITNFKTQLGYNGKCGQGGGPGYNAVISRIKIAANGKFSKRTTLKLLTFHAPGEVTGKASGDKVTGKVLEFAQGKPNKCYVETFTARLT
jgi:hypothetical protein